MSGSSEIKCNPSVMITAWRGTGKDTLVQHLSTEQITVADADCTDALWVVYSDSSDQALNKIYPLLANQLLVRKFSLDEALRVETHEWLRLRDCPADAFEQCKDTLTCLNPTGVRKSIRQHYIDYGQAARRKDPSIWIRPVIEAIECKKFYYPGLQKGTIDVISDWQFENELVDRQYCNEYCNEGSKSVYEPKENIITIRLHRKDVAVPEPLADQSTDPEHNLDNFVTDYLFIPPGEEEAKLALERFPQYNNYKPMLSLSVGYVLS
jgi:hypothetical protein